jgi:hypothetical protein
MFMNAHIKPRAADWATDLAITIISEAHQPYFDAVELIATRLRYVRAQGVCDGVEKCQMAVKAAFARHGEQK